VGDVRAVAFYDNYLFAAAYLTANLSVFDITDPANPVQIAQVAAAATAISFHFDHANETRDGVVHHTRAEAEVDNENYEGKTTEAAST
jgi:hypothetical protein